MIDYHQIKKNIEGNHSFTKLAFSKTTHHLRKATNIWVLKNW